MPAKDLAALIVNNDTEGVLQEMRPLIRHMAQKFAATNTPCAIDEDDYVQEASLGVLQALAALRRTKDSEKDKACFLKLCQMRIFSRLYEYQKKNMLPIHASMKVSRVVQAEYQAGHRTIEPEALAHKHKISMKLAMEVSVLLRAEFHTAEYEKNDKPIASRFEAIAASEITTILTAKFPDVMRAKINGDKIPPVGAERTRFYAQLKKAKQEYKRLIAARKETRQ